MNYLSVENLAKSYGERLLFSEVSFGLDQGQKMAFIAKNGSGKTTLMRILAGLDTPDSGVVTYRNGITISYLQQEPELNLNNTIHQEVYQSDNQFLQAIEAYHNCLENQSNNLQEAMERMDLLGAWDYESKVQTVLEKLAINDLNKPISKLSGGQKKRVALAKVLIQEPDFVIMDEPTNHLDIDMVEWLEQYIAKSSLTLLLVTHDRYFLENTCTVILELDAGVVYKHSGNYASYLESKQLRYENLEATIDKAKNLYRKELEWMRKQPKARGTKAKSRIDSFYDVKKVAHTKVDKREVELEINMNRLGSKILEFHNVKKSFGDLCIAKNFNYKFQREDRVGIIGKNGVGKSTFLQMIMQNEQPTEGKIVVGDTIVFGYYNQNGLQFDDSKRVIEIIKDIAEFIPLTKGKQLSAAQMLERFLFSREQHYQYVSKLSGGEKRRLYLLTILMQNPNFLILDEPTNDLDILTLNVLEDFLEDFQGCLLVVTHDRYFMDRLVEHCFVFEGDGEIRDFPGNYTQYREWRTEREQQLKVEAKKQNEQPVEKPIAEVKSEPKRKLSFNEKREFEQLESEIAALENEKEQLNEQLNSGALSAEDLLEASNKIGKVIEQLDEKELRWLELSEYQQ